MLSTCRQRARYLIHSKWNRCTGNTQIKTHRKLLSLFESKTVPGKTLSTNYSTSCALANSQVPDPLLDAPSSIGEPSFRKILIANRGEIARRIIRTCRTEGIKTVAIYSTIDSKSPHVTEADEAVCVGPTASSASYLDVANVCKAIEITGAEAVHPGYGFLSENAEFARKVEKMISPSGNPVKFIGPSSSAIVAMGDKITSKQIAHGANVNIIPGFDGFVTSQDHAVTIAKQIGYPVMIKATSGGGGKGMRICYNDAEIKEGFLLSTAEAKSFFNDERLFIEKFIEKPHHIEIQLLAGRKDGGELEILCFPERECSIQRRNQKVLEESPSPLLKPETRAEMVRQVKRLVREVDYSSAGTVEFLVDEEQNFYFLEMNTRLQVEHPVTEMVSGGVDLVHGMIDVAAGKGIPQEYLDKLGDQTGLSPEERDGLSIPHTGYAIEARIYAEDPLRGFLPSTGPLLEYIEPEISSNEDDCEIRLDSGVVPGSIISQYYDPMISKLIAHSPDDRAKAIGALRKALNAYVITGIRHNCSFLIDVLRHESFIAGDTPTNFIQAHYPDGFSGVSLSNTECLELAAIAATASIVRGEVLQRPSLPFHFIKDGGPFEVVCLLGGQFGKPFLVKSYEDLRVSPLCDEDGAAEDIVDIEHIEMGTSDPVIKFRVNGQDKVLQIQREDSTGEFSVRYEGAEFDVIIMSRKEYDFSRFMKEPQKVDTSNFILSPMPGTLMSYSVKDGDVVIDGQDICVVEAMKMQNVIRASQSGIIKNCHAVVGSSLMADEVIVEFEQSGEEPKCKYEGDADLWMARYWFRLIAKDWARLMTKRWIIRMARYQLQNGGGSS